MARALAESGRARPKPKSMPWLKPGVWIGALVPLFEMAWRAATGTLGANPISEVLNRLGLLALIFLLASLACTPLRLAFEWAWPARLRRLLGLFSFFYASLHFAAYIGLDRLGARDTLLEDLTQRPFISVGFLAFLALVPLAATSTKGMIKRLGAVRWRKLHRLAYAAAALAVLHFAWRVKADISEPLAYAMVLALLLGVRVRRAARTSSGEP